jgi:integrase
MNTLPTTTTTTTDVQLASGVSLDRIVELHDARNVPNTVRTRASHIKMLVVYCQENGWSWNADGSAPFRIDWLASHITELHDRGASLSTIDGRLDAIGVWSASHGYSSPVNDFVKETRDGITNERAEKMQSGAYAVKVADAITREDLHAMVRKCDTTTLVGKRDKALLLIGWHGAFRRSELASLALNNVSTWQYDGRDGLTCHVFNTKTDKHNAVVKQLDRQYTADICPVRAFEDWIQCAGITDGAVFRSVSKGGKVGASLSSRAVDLIVRKYSDGYSAHSLRAGYATQSVMDNINGVYARKQGGWAPTSGVFDRYAQRAQVGAYARVRIM